MEFLHPVDMPNSGETDLVQGNEKSAASRLVGVGEQQHGTWSSSAFAVAPKGQQKVESRGENPPPGSRRAVRQSGLTVVTVGEKGAENLV